MFSRIAVIALNTYREAVRARVLHGLFALAVATAVYAWIVGNFALRSILRVTSDLGSAAMGVYAIIAAVVLAGTSLHRELELKTVFPILARPIRRWEYLTGKFLGTLLTLLVFVAGNAAVLLLALALAAERPWVQPVGALLGSLAVAGVLAWRLPRWRTWLPLPWALALLGVGAFLAVGAPDDRRVVLGSALLVMLEVAIVAGVATVFSSFSSPILSSVFTLGAFVVGRSADTLGRLPPKVFGELITDTGRALSHVVPNLMVYVPPRPLLTGESAQSLAAYLGLAAVQALAWSVGLLTVASFIFRRRDFP